MARETTTKPATAWRVLGWTGIGVLGLVSAVITYAVLVALGR